MHHADFRYLYRPSRLRLPRWASWIWSSEGKWVHLAKIGFEKYFIHKIRSGQSEPFYEKLALHALGIRKLRFK